MMRRTMAYFRVQVKTYMAERSAIFVSLIFPVMMVFIFGSIMPSEYLTGVIPGLIGFSILTDSLFAVTAVASKYRLMHIFNQLSLTPLRRSEWLFSVFLWHVIIGAASFAIIVGIGYFAFSANITLHLLIIPFIAFGALLFVSMGLLIGTVAKSSESAGIIGNAVGFPMMVLTGTFFPVSFLPWYLQQAVKVLPLYYFVQGMGDVMVTGDFNEGLLYLGVLIALAAGFFLAGTYLFRWREK